MTEEGLQGVQWDSYSHEERKSVHSGAVGFPITMGQRTQGEEKAESQCPCVGSFYSFHPALANNLDGEPLPFSAHVLSTFIVCLFLCLVHFIQGEVEI